MSKGGSHSSLSQTSVSTELKKKTERRGRWRAPGVCRHVGHVVFRKASAPEAWPEVGFEATDDIPLRRQRL